MSGAGRLAELLHEEWDRRLCETSKLDVPSYDCIDSAAHLAAANVVVLTPETLAWALREISRIDPEHRGEITAWLDEARSILAALAGKL